MINKEHKEDETFEDKLGFFLILCYYLRKDNLLPTRQKTKRKILAYQRLRRDQLERLESVAEDKNVNVQTQTLSVNQNTQQLTQSVIDNHSKSSNHLAENIRQPRFSKFSSFAILQSSATWDTPPSYDECHKLSRIDEDPN
ncbi:CLUMA_CG007726, isoform A [Clunio marinus]|uniref:CLUMA_CG007726, isoform A n=1 Tax=Clunio marinus TaxID=568069 RepID=A0A1J1I1X3_9DIPT|nr:CLUMA_CG007726, isoform A [Clunio marinus]